MFIRTFLFSLLMLSAFSGCRKTEKAKVNSPLTFSTSFESIDDFKGFYIVPQNYMNTSSHQLTSELFHSGNYSHKAWIYGGNPENTASQNNNHRAYPTIQFQKTAGGVFHTPCYISFWVWLEMDLVAHTPENQWFSFATLTTDSTDNWSRTILVNLSCEGFVHLMHVPLQGEKIWDFQTSSLTFPKKEWVNIKIYIDTRPEKVYAKVWQNGILVSSAKIADGNGLLAQAHFGLYAAPSVSSGTVYNDDLEINEVSGE